MTHALAVEDFSAFERQISTAAACSRPVRLRGKVTAVDLASGDTAAVYDTASESGGVLHVACGNRRESACPACSAIYKRDARQLVRAGLVGGKGVPESVAAHPCVFATLTAPSFGPVHSRRERNGKVLPCRPRRDANKRVCPHGRDISCAARHAKDDPRLGRAMCGDCYDYRAAVLFNAAAGELWRRFTTYLPRHLARLGGISQKQFRELVKVRFVKVAEYQARGVVHFHALIRLDASTDAYAPPDPEWTTDRLEAAVKAAAVRASALAPVGKTGRALLLTFGTQTDVRPVLHGLGDTLTRDAVANYIAKYATKTADAPGLPSSRLRSLDEIQALRCSAHHKRMIETAWHLGHRQWAHMLGYGGHFLTKSRAYSVTFGQLRRARAEHRRAQRYDPAELDPWGRPVSETTVLFLGSWTYAGSGYAASDAHLLALMSADSARSSIEHKLPPYRTDRSRMENSGAVD
ncbi:MAG TPA: replication initiator [Trebonia sp.]